jgi:hypothetical protein
MRFDGAYRVDGVRYLGRLKGLLGLAGLLVAALWAGPAPAADSQAIPDLHFSVIDQPGETSVRLPLASDSSLLYGMLSPYLSLGSSTPLARPLDTGLPPGLRRDTDGFDDVRMGAGLAEGCSSGSRTPRTSAPASRSASTSTALPAAR